MPVLPKSDVDAYTSDGILSPYAVLGEPEREAALATVARIEAQPADIRRDLMVHKSYLVSATLAGICRNPAILDRVESLITPKPSPKATCCRAGRRSRSWCQLT